MLNHLKELGKAIARARKAKGWSQAKLAEETGVKQGTVSAWEAGEIDLPYNTICRIAGKLETSPATLMATEVPVTESLESMRNNAIRLILDAGAEDVSNVLRILS